MGVTIRIDWDGNDRIAAVQELLGQLWEGMQKMATSIDHLTAEVEETRGLVQSTTVMIQGLEDQIRDLKNNPTPEAIDALADSLHDAVQPLAQALTANPSPSDPTPPAPPTTEDTPPDTTPAV